MKTDTKEKFKELQSAVFNGDQSAIDNWFINNNFKKTTKIAKETAHYICNSTYFFSFRSASTNKDFLKQEELRRENTILKHFALKEQLDILYFIDMFCELKMENLRVLNYNPKKEKEIAIKNKYLSLIVTKLFNKEKFNEIEEVENIFKFNVLDVKFCFASFYYKEKSMTGTMTFNIKEELFKPYYDIIFNYNTNKKNYIESKGLELPDSKEVNMIHEKIVQDILTQSYLARQQDMKKIENKIDEYLTNIKHEELSSLMPDKKENNKKIRKI